MNKLQVSPPAPDRGPGGGAGGDGGGVDRVGLGWRVWWHGVVVAIGVRVKMHGRIGMRRTPRPKTPRIQEEVQIGERRVALDYLKYKYTVW